MLVKNGLGCKGPGKFVNFEKLDPCLLPKLSEAGLVIRIDNLNITQTPHGRCLQNTLSSQCDAVQVEYCAAREDISARDSTTESFVHSGHCLDGSFQCWGECQVCISMGCCEANSDIATRPGYCVKENFSINKETSIDNLSEECLMAHRQIVDAVRQVCEITRFPLSKKLLSYASSFQKNCCEHSTKEKTTGNLKKGR